MCGGCDSVGYNYHTANRNAIRSVLVYLHYLYSYSSVKNILWKTYRGSKILIAYTHVSVNEPLPLVNILHRNSAYLKAIRTHKRPELHPPSKWNRRFVDSVGCPVTTPLLKTYYVWFVTVRDKLDAYVSGLSFLLSFLCLYFIL